MDYYEYTMQRRINRRAIMGGLRFLNAIREPQVALNRLLWHGYSAPAQTLKTPCISLQNIYNNQHCTRGLIG